MRWRVASSKSVRPTRNLMIPGRSTWTLGAALVVVLCAAGCGKNAAFEAEKSGPREEQVRFPNGEVTLAGTLVLPAGTGKHPGVVLFHGSGPQARDLFTARWFAGEGIAALAYDKRGVGDSTGNFKKVPFMELCGDGLAGLALLKSRPEIDAKRIGVWGLSQGGWLGPLAASKSGDVAWVIAVSGPAVSPGEQMIFYYAEELRAKGLSESDVREASELRRKVWTYAESGVGYESAQADLERARAKHWYADVKAQQDDLFGLLLTPEEQAKPGAAGYRWFRQEANYDPVMALKALRVPALFLFGDEDRLVPVAESVAVIRRVEAEGGKKNFTIRVFPHVDHAMFRTTSGDLEPEYPATMRAWLKERVRK